MTTVGECPFCTIPGREKLLYSDDLVYLVKTLDMKGHAIRVTVATHRHTTDPTFEELTKSYAVLYDYMNSLRLDEWYIVDKTFGRWPDHWHIVSCDALGTPEELILLAKTPKVKFPLRRILIETIFWGTVWARPYTTLGIPALASSLCALYFGGMLVYFYTKLETIILSYVLLTGGFLGLWLILCLATFFITIQRRFLREIK